MFCKKGLLRNFAKFTGKHLRQRYFFHKIADARNFIKNETLIQVSSCEFCGFSKNTFFTEHLRTTVSASLDYALTSCGIWLNADFATWNLLMENITPVSTIAFKVHVVMTLVFQKKCDVKFLHWHEICSSWEKAFQIAFSSIWLIFAEINEHCQEMFGIFFSKPIIVGPGTLIVALFVAATSLQDFFYPPPEVGKFTEEWWDNMRAEQGRWLLLILFPAIQNHLVLFSESLPDAWQGPKYTSALHVQSVNPFYVTGLFLHPLKTSGNLWFYDAFRGRCRKRQVELNGLISYMDYLHA